MRALIYTQTGDPDVLTLIDRPLADPGPGEVRVRLHRSGVNPTDWKARRAARPGIPVDPPQVPNRDGAGVVDAVGPGVEEALLGLRVWVWEAAYQRVEGTAQEHASCRGTRSPTCPTWRRTTSVPRSVSCSSPRTGR